MIEGLKPVEGMNGCYDYNPEPGDILYRSKKYDAAVIRLTCSETDYAVTFNLYEVVGWNGDNVSGMIAPMARVYLKWDGCSTWYRHEDDSHICGYYSLLRRQEIERWAFKTAHSLIKNADAECAGIESEVK